MIKNYKQFNESLRDLMVGPTEDEVLNSLKDLSPNQLLLKCSVIGILKGVKSALDNGADIHNSNEEPLRYASSNGHRDVVRFLLDNGADIHIMDDVPLKWASEYSNSIETVKLLLDRGANIHAGDDYALVMASERGYTNMVKLLLDRGSNVHADNDAALKWASEYNHTDTIKLLKSYMNKKSE